MIMIRSQLKRRNKFKKRRMIFQKSLKMATLPSK
jgi:hypothetical protein